MSARNQKGGGKQYIGELTPDITNPATLKSNCDFFYVSAHGETDLERWTTVPDDTFVVFIGVSGFTTKVAHKAEWLLHGANYHKTMYDTYFSEGGANAKTRPYANQHVYVPGDLLPNLGISFKSDLQDFWAKGVFKCPVRDPNIFNVELPEHNLVFMLSELANIKRNSEIISAASPVEPYWTNFISLSKSERLEYLEENPEKKKLNLWFTYPHKDTLGLIANREFIKDPDNLYKNPQPQSSLSGIINGPTTKTDKKYKFIIVCSCRPPTNFLESEGNLMFLSELKPIMEVSDPRNLALLVRNSRRTLARRASFSVKPSEEICATRDDPPMNVFKILDTLTSTITAFNQAKRQGVSVGEKETAYVLDVLGMFNLPSIPIQMIANLLLDRLFISYPLLVSEDPKKQEAKLAFARFISSIQASLGAFMIGIHFDTAAKQANMFGIHFDSATAEKKANMFGRQLLEQAGFHDKEIPLNYANIENITAKQKEFIADPKWAALKMPRTAAEQSRLIAAKNAALNAVRIRVEKEGKELLKTKDMLFKEINKLFDLTHGKEYHYFIATGRTLNTGNSYLVRNKEGTLRDLRELIAKFEKVCKEARDVYDSTPIKHQSEYLYNKLILDIHSAEKKLKELQKIEKRLVDEIEKERGAAEPAAEPAAKPASKPRNNNRNVTKKASTAKWNEKELLKWRREWLSGVRNPKRDEVRLKQWAAYRQTMTAEQRAAQNRTMRKEGR